jgi:hypothetical protein
LGNLLGVHFWTSNKWQAGISMRRAALVCLAAFALIGCDPVAGSVRATPPPGGWPQPSGKWLTERMCGLLTKADYTGPGHMRQPSSTINALNNSVDCQYQAGEEMTLSLAPTAEFARYVFSTGLQSHLDRLAAAHRRSELARDVMGATDESWFDVYTATLAGTVANPEIQVRHGALILDITLSGAREKDPRGVLTKLADLVLRRLPHVGEKDTGTTYTISYEASGAGQARSVEWHDYGGVEDARIVQNVGLPWVHTVKVATGGRIEPHPPAMWVKAGSPGKKVSCLITIDGVLTVSTPPIKDLTVCVAEIPAPSKRAKPA